MYGVAFLGVQRNGLGKQEAIKAACFLVNLVQDLP